MSCQPSPPVDSVEGESLWFGGDAEGVTPLPQPRPPRSKATLSRSPQLPPGAVSPEGEDLDKDANSERQSTRGSKAEISTTLPGENAPELASEKGPGIPKFPSLSGGGASTNKDYSDVVSKLEILELPNRGAAVASPKSELAYAGDKKNGPANQPPVLADKDGAALLAPGQPAGDIGAATGEVYFWKSADENAKDSQEDGALAGLDLEPQSRFDSKPGSQSRGKELVTRFSRGEKGQIGLDEKGPGYYFDSSATDAPELTEESVKRPKSSLVRLPKSKSPGSFNTPRNTNHQHPSPNRYPLRKPSYSPI